MILWPLILLDVASGLILITRFGYLIFWFGLFSFVKGLWSLYTSIKAGFFFDWMGVIDLIAGICMILTSYGVYYSFFIILGVALVIKGIYSFFGTLHA